MIPGFLGGLIVAISAVQRERLEADVHAAPARVLKALPDAMRGEAATVVRLTAVHSTLGQPDR